MGFSTVGKNAMLDALAALITHVGVLQAGTAITGVTGTNSTDLLNKSSHGLSNGDKVIVTEKTGGSNVVAGNAGNADELARLYYVVGVSGSDFQLALTSGGSAIDLGSDISSCKVTKLTEVSGGSYGRVSIAWNAAADGSIDDSTNGATINMPAGSVGDYLGYFSASTAGNLHAIDKSTSETFVSDGTLQVTDADLDLNAGA